MALSASALKADQELFVAAGCTAYLTKPIKEAVLLQAIREHAVVAAPDPVSPPSLASLATIQVPLGAKIAQLAPPPS